MALTDRREGDERVILVHVNFPDGKMREDLDEFKELAISAGAEIVLIVTGTQRVPESKYFVRKGKAEEIREAVLATKAGLVLFNHTLSPAQERNLERLISCRVLDRTSLILDIFAQRARSFEGKLQVELALLKHWSTRLIRGWTHLERQRGGIGLRGPGETQLEADRRLIRNKIKIISSRLTKIRKQRAQSRRARHKATIPTIALVGYTNAGKSTLFNALTGETVYVANQLFATLDPTLRRIHLPEYGPVILADTVGFIRHLPHNLIEAFHATLEEVAEADLLLHVIDASDINRQAYISEVNHVLELIGASQVPCLPIYNKIDLCHPDLTEKIDYDELGKVKEVYISARQKQGLDKLFLAINQSLEKDLIEKAIILSPKEGKLRAAFYEKETVLSENIDEEGNYHLVLRIPRITLEKLLRFR